MMRNNFILQTDSYKLTHWKQYPEGTTKVYSYLESRGGKFDSTLFFGLQYYLKEYFEGQVVTQEDIIEAEEFSKQHFGVDTMFNKEGWQYIVDKYDGKLPLRIKAVKEGNLVPVSNVLLTIENTDPKCFWLTNHAETMISKLWYSITVATNSFYSKKLLKKYLKETNGNFDVLGFKLHDFGYRGVSSEETAGIGGAAHLVNFKGTDTILATRFLREYYGANQMTAFSVAASEHSISTAFGKENEEDYFLNMIRKYPTGIVSIVSDTYDVYNFVGTMSKKHKEEILNRNGSVVFRPDSGDPIEINMKLIDVLWNIFGGTYHNGYKILVPQVRLLQGDGVDYDMMEKFLSTAKANNWSTDNWVFGSGGGLLQKFDRDTQKFAIKASYMEQQIGDEIIGKSIVKDPITMSSKKSKPGILKLHRSGGKYSTISSERETKPMFNSYTDELETVFENGELKRFQNIEDIRKISESYL